MSERLPMTRAGYEKLEEELRRLKSVERVKIVKEIEIARAHGDISENAEFHAAKERQSHIEGRVRVIEDKLARAVVIDPSGQPPDEVRFGAAVTIVGWSASADQAVPTAAGSGATAGAFASAEIRDEHVALLLEIRSCLVAHGLFKGAA